MSTPWQGACRKSMRPESRTATTPTAAAGVDAGTSASAGILDGLPVQEPAPAATDTPGSTSPTNVHPARAPFDGYGARNHPDIGSRDLEQAARARQPRRDRSAVA